MFRTPFRAEHIKSIFKRRRTSAMHISFKRQFSRNKTSQRDNTSQHFLPLVQVLLGVSLCILMIIIKSIPDPLETTLHFEKPLARRSARKRSAAPLCGKRGVLDHRRQPAIFCQVLEFQALELWALDSGL